MKSNDVNNVILTQGITRIEFNQHMKTWNGWLDGVEKYLITKETPDKKINHIKFKNINELCRALGHLNKGTTQATGENMGDKVVVLYQPCESS